MPHSRASIAQVETGIANLDLQEVVYRLTNPPDPQEEKWPWKLADAVESQYRDYLLLSAFHPIESSVPTWLVEKLWVAHTLDSEKYAADCQQIFGRNLKHYPFFDLRGAESVAALRAASVEACRRRDEHFLGEVAAKARTVRQSVKGSALESLGVTGSYSRSAPLGTRSRTSGRSTGLLPSRAASLFLLYLLTRPASSFSTTTRAATPRPARRTSTSRGSFPKPQRPSG